MSLSTALLSQLNDIVQLYFIIILMICLNSLTRESRLKLKWEALLFLIFLLLLPSISIVHENPGDNPEVRYIEFLSMDSGSELSPAEQLIPLCGKFSTLGILR